MDPRTLAAAVESRRAGINRRVQARRAGIVAEIIQVWIRLDRQSLGHKQLLWRWLVCFLGKFRCGRWMLNPELDDSRIRRPKNVVTPFESRPCI